MKAFSTGMLAVTTLPSTVAVKMLKQDATEQELIDFIQVTQQPYRLYPGNTMAI